MFNIQIVRFGIIGLCAMLTHLLTFIILVNATLNPLLANIIAFLVAFQVSYYGQARWTFSGKDSRKNQIRYFAVAVFGLVLNETSYIVLLNVFHLQYLTALIIVILGVALITFALSKLWAFRQ